ncbi:MAG: 5'-3' exonuclease H3TH domain-containing protein, partial [Sedimenticola sp.]
MAVTPPFILVDGSSYLFRAYHALPPLTNSHGEATGAIVGVINMLRKLIDEYKPEHMAVVFDAPGGSFRNEMYDQYKANRPPMPDDLREQIEPLHRIVKALGLPLLMVPGVEADDVIGTLASQASSLEMNTLISTGDKDLAQLVDERVTLINTMSNSLMDREGVVAKFGVTPEQIIDYLALVGDSSDNIPGIPKCGPKTAVKWLGAYGSADQLVTHADEIKGKVGEYLRENLEQLALSRELTTIRLDLDLDATPAELKPTAPDRETLHQLYSRIEARRLLATLEEGESDAAEVESAPPLEVRYETILEQTDLDRWLARLEHADCFAFDTETTSLDYMQAEIVGLSFAIEAGEAAYLPLAHIYPGAPTQLERAVVLAAMKPLLENPKRLKVGQNLKYDMSVLARYDITLRGVAHDTMLESYVLDSTATRHDMDSLANKYLGLKTIKFEEVAGKGAKQLTFDQVPLEAAAPYAAEDADITLRLHQTLWSKLEREPSL